MNDMGDRMLPICEGFSDLQAHFKSPFSIWFLERYLESSTLWEKPAKYQAVVNCGGCSIANAIPSCVAAKNNTDTVWLIEVSSKPSTLFQTVDLPAQPLI